jgi:hypothetical protein
MARRLILGVLSIAVAASLWLPLLHLLYTPGPRLAADGGGMPAAARQLAQYHLHLWTDPELLEKETSMMRSSNAEWDFMGRTFLVCAFANMALREPGKKKALLEVMDRIIDETLRLEEHEGMYYFLMPYARSGDYRIAPPRSLFIDGEIALMLAHRRIVEEKRPYRRIMRERVELMVGRMKQSPVLSAESYPDECWTFCNSVALAAVRMADFLDGSDHSAFLRLWVATARKKLLHPATGLLVSSYRLDGTWKDGPEGSSIWMAAHSLRIVDEKFAADQYARAKKELAGSFLGFGYSREWPPSWQGPADIDSGPVIPFLKISPGASGLALLGASSFGDAQYFRQLMASLNLAAFPSRKGGGITYSAANEVGSAVLLYAAVQGPVWKKVGGGGGQWR